MLLPARTLWLLVLLPLGLAGCTRCVPPLCPCLPPGHAVFPLGELPAVSRTPAQPVLAKLTFLPAAGEPPPAALHYHALSPVQCQALAADAAPLARLLEQERAVLHAREGGRRHACERAGPDRHARDLLLCHAAAEDRNRNAARALELYWCLAEAEAAWDLLEEALAGCPIPDPSASDGAAQARLVELGAQRAELRLRIRRLNGELWHLLNLEGCDEYTRLWPGCEGLTCLQPPPDPDTAVAVGLARHPDLVLLRQLVQGLTPAALPAVREWLKHCHYALGTGDRAGDCTCLSGLLRLGHPGRGACLEVEARRRQIEAQLLDREQQVGEAVRQAVHHIATRGELVRLAGERLAVVHARVQAARAHPGPGTSTPAGLAAGCFDEWQARCQLLAALRNWHLAVVELKKSQGVLAEACLGEEGLPGGCYPVIPSPAPGLPGAPPAAIAEPPPMTRLPDIVAGKGTAAPVWWQRLTSGVASQVWTRHERASTVVEVDGNYGPEVVATEPLAVADAPPPVDHPPGPGLSERPVQPSLPARLWAVVQTAGGAVPPPPVAADVVRGPELPPAPAAPAQGPSAARLSFDAGNPAGTPVTPPARLRLEPR